MLKKMNAAPPHATCLLEKEIKRVAMAVNVSRVLTSLFADGAVHIHREK
jgi:hypothetical protein